VLLLLGLGALSYLASQQGPSDEKTCSSFEDLQVPKTDQEIEPYLAKIQSYGDEAKSSEVKNAIQSFVGLSLKYFELLDSASSEIDLEQANSEVTLARAEIIDVCSRYLLD
jgi:hypothetical protein